jgi:hypothetical protein
MVSVFGGLRCLFVCVLSVRVMVVVVVVVVVMVACVSGVPNPFATPASLATTQIQRVCQPQHGRACEPLMRVGDDQ